MSGRTTEQELRVVGHAPSATGGLDVRPVSLGVPDGHRAAGVAAASIVAVVGLALVGGWLATPSAATRSPGRPAVVAPAPPAKAVPAAPASVAPHTTPTLSGPVDVAFFRRVLDSGAMTGRVIVATGQPFDAVAECGAGDPDPCRVELQGLPGVPIVPADSTSGPGLWAAFIGGGNPGPMALRVDEAGRLVYLGHLDAANQPAGIGRIRRIQPSSDALQLVDGWLLPWRPAGPCVGAPDSWSSCAQPSTSWLSDVDPGAAAQLVPDQSVEVALPRDAGLAAWPSAGHGRFLVRHVTDPGPDAPQWEVIAAVSGAIPRLDLSSATTR